MNVRIRFKWQELYFVIMWLLAVCLYAMMPVGSGLLGVVYYGIHIITVGTFLALLWRSRITNSFNASRLVAIAIICTAILLSAVASDQKITFSKHIMGAVGFLEMLMAIYIIDSLEHKKELIRFVFWANVVSALIFVRLYFTPYAYSSDIVGSLNLGYSNPNAAAIYLLMTFSILTIYFEKQERFLRKIAALSLGVFLIYLIYLTKSRMCLVAAAIILVYRFFLPKWSVPKWTILIFQLIPFAFLFTYAYWYKQGMYSSEMFLGKEFFSGREGYYIEMLDQLRTTWIIGNFGRHFFENAHNGPLAILLGCGALGFLAYLWFINSTIRYYLNGVETHRQKMALVILFAVFVHSCGEAAMTVGGAHYSILTATIYWILKGNGRNLVENSNA